MTAPANPLVLKLKTAATYLEITSILISLFALAYRATLYWLLPASSDGTPGLAPLLDFSLAMLLFAVCLLCAGAGVGIHMQGEISDRRYAYRAFFIGVLSFLIYDLLYPHIPRLL